MGPFYYYYERFKKVSSGRGETAQCEHETAPMQRRAAQRNSKYKQRNSKSEAGGQVAIGLLGGGLNLIWGGLRCGGHGHQGAAEHTPHLGGGARGGSMCVLGVA